MKEIMKIFKNNNFIRNVTILSSGTAAAQAISLLSAPIITRLYGPEIYGFMGVFIAISQIFVPIAALTYPFAIVLPRKKEHAKKLIKLSIYITVFIAILIFLILVLFYESIISLFQLKEVGAYIYLIPLVVIFGGLMQVLNQWLIRTKQFSVNAKATLLQSLMINGSKISLGFMYPLASVLIILTASSNGVKALFMYTFMDESKFKDDEIDDSSLGDLAKKHRDFPLYRAPEVLLNGVSQRFPILMLSSFFGPAAAGFYTLGNTVLQQPIRLIGESVGNVFYPRITEAAHNNENLTNLIKKATLSLSALGIVPFGLIIIFGPWIFEFIFGQEWVTAGIYAQWIALFLFFEFINKPSVKTLPVISAQLFHLIFTTVTLVVRLLSLAIGYFIFSSDIVAIAIFSSSSAMMHLILIFYVTYKAKTNKNLQNEG